MVVHVFHPPDIGRNTCRACATFSATFSVTFSNTFSVTFSRFSSFCWSYPWASNSKGSLAGPIGPARYLLLTPKGHQHVAELLYVFLPTFFMPARKNYYTMKTDMILVRYNYEWLQYSRVATAGNTCSDSATFRWPFGASNKYLAGPIGQLMIPYYCWPGDMASKSVKTMKTWGKTWRKNVAQSLYVFSANVRWRLDV